MKHKMKKTTFKTIPYVFFNIAEPRMKLRNSKMTQSFCKYLVIESAELLQD